MKKILLETAIVTAFLFTCLYFSDRILFACFAAIPFFFFLWRAERRAGHKFAREALKRVIDIQELTDKKVRFIDANGRYMSKDKRPLWFLIEFRELIQDIRNFIK